MLTMNDKDYIFIASNRKDCLLVKVIVKQCTDVNIYIIGVRINSLRPNWLLHLKKQQCVLIYEA